MGFAGIDPTNPTNRGVSFVANFIGHREYERTTTTALMRAPYGRVVVMQLVVIIGGWIVVALGDTRPPLRPARRRSSPPGPFIVLAGVDHVNAGTQRRRETGS